MSPGTEALHEIWMVPVTESHCLGTPCPFTSDQWLASCVKPSEANIRSLMKSLPNHLPHALLFQRDAAREFSRRHADLFERRRIAGRAVDGHGDLHLRHIWFERDDSAPLMIDCLEFDEELRKTDAAAEVAILAMDLGYRDHPDFAERFLRVYARESDDFDLYGVVDYFISYRAAVRAKVAAIAAVDGEVESDQRARAAESARRHLELAASSLESRRVGSVVMVGGVVGAGKTTVASALADQLNGVVISSDRVRKRLVGLAPTDHRPAPPDTGIYTPELSQLVLIRHSSARAGAARGAEAK